MSMLPLPVLSHPKRLAWGLLLLSTIFLLGYQLRAYHDIHSFLPYSPYEAYDAHTLERGDRFFSDHIPLYPTKFLIRLVTETFFGSLYVLYLAGFVAVFLLGRFFSKNDLGGVLAVMLYAIAPDNLLQYTKTVLVNDSGVSYIAALFAILSLGAYLRSRLRVWLLLFFLCGVIALTSYHTGAAAFAIILLASLGSLALSSMLSISSAITIGGLLLLYSVWLIFVDPEQFALFYQTVRPDMLAYALAGLLVAVGVLFLFSLSRFSKRLYSLSEWLPLLAVVSGALLLLSDTDIFGRLLGVSSDSGGHYLSLLTLNSALAQALLVCLYSSMVVPFFSKRILNLEQTLLRGWMVGVVLVGVALIAGGYMSRIPDYLFPICYVFFACYWSDRFRFRKIVVIATVLLLVVAQLRILEDPFSQRRFYTLAEVESARAVAARNLAGPVMSDLRTAALLRYVGMSDVQFFSENSTEHHTLFYGYDQLYPSDDTSYVILTRAMRDVVYATNFQTTPLDASVYAFYRERFTEVYSDGIFYVYELSVPPNLQ